MGLLVYGRLIKPVIKCRVPACALYQQQECPCVYVQVNKVKEPPVCNKEEKSLREPTKQRLQSRGSCLV